MLEDPLPFRYTAICLRAPSSVCDNAPTDFVLYNPEMLNKRMFHFPVPVGHDKKSGGRLQTGDKRLSGHPLLTGRPTNLVQACCIHEETRVR